MELKINGTIKEIGEVQEFASGFKKLTWVLETEGDYPQSIPFDVVKDKADTFSQYNNVGDKVEVNFNIRSNEYGGKYFVNLQAWKIEKLAQTEAKQPETTNSYIDDSDDLPF